MAVLTITEGNFQQEVLDSAKPVVLDFWASWCGPCKMQGPIFDEAAEKFGDKAVFGKVNVDEEQELAQKFGVMSIPTLIVMENGELKSKNVGVHPLAAIEKFI